MKNRGYGVGVNGCFFEWRTANVKIILEMVMIIQVMAGKIQYTVRNEDDFEGI